MAVISGFSVPAGVFNAIQVAQLPAAQTGAIASVFDGAIGLTFGNVVAGGGGSKYLVWYNGVNWTIIGT